VDHDYYYDDTGYVHRDDCRHLDHYVPVPPCDHGCGASHVEGCAVSQWMVEHSETWAG